jgi:hypothetical protein
MYGLNCMCYVYKHGTETDRLCTAWLLPCFDQGGGGGGRNLGCFLNLACIDGLSPDQRDDMGTLEY